ncbi:MAG TPA: hypothetical protein VFR96_16535 [Povalibacter sp.]|nr:hypothetical protein [Povalibacter sp.]
MPRRYSLAAAPPAAVSILIMIAGGCASAPSATSEQTMTSSLKPSASRIAPPSVAAIEFEGKRYMQIENGARQGLGQRTGLMAVFDIATNARLAVVRIYDERRDERLEQDAGDVFFIRFTLDAAQREILIENERHERYAYSIDSGEVRTLK